MLEQAILPKVNREWKAFKSLVLDRADSTQPDLVGASILALIFKGKALICAEAAEVKPWSTCAKTTIRVHG